MPVPHSGPRGYSVVALDNPKSNNNVGGVLRAAQCFGAAMVVIRGQRYTRATTDTTKAYRHLPLLTAGHDAVDNILDLIPFDCVPVAVDLVEGAIPLPQYIHPERAYYIFGAEDATLGEKVISRCRDKVYIPMSVGCLNLAACVNVVLYDRAAKQGHICNSRDGLVQEWLSKARAIASRSERP